MHTEIKSCLIDLPGDGGLDSAVRFLAEELRATRAEARRQRWRVRAMTAVLACLLAVAVWSALTST
jgi:hypothetical protein